MKRGLLTALLTAALLLLPCPGMAAPPDFNGGVQDEYNYEEIVFLSGEPVKFSGTFTITEKEKTDSKTIDYKFTLTPEDSTVSGKLDRKFTYDITYDKRDDKGQTIAQQAVKKGYKETVTINADKYDLEDYQFSRSDIIDNRPASDFYSGTIQARKTYSVNKGEGTVVVKLSGGDVGFENFWGSTETQLIDCSIDCERKIDDESYSWQGTVKISSSDSTAKTLKYAENEASYSSFRGGNMRVTSRSMVSRYEYNLPKMNKADNGDNANQTSTVKIPDDTKRKTGTTELSKSMLPKVERLIIPKFRDTGGHWAEEDINQLYSLDVFSGSTTFFLPDIPMTRRDFTRAVVKAANIRTSSEQKITRTASRRTVPEQSPFQDLPSSDTDYAYIKEAVSKGIINGVSAQMFMPDQPLTRAQAITILIRALGFENKAPTPGFYTSFADDYDIPNWSRDCIYVAREIGLIQGDNNNRVNPGQVMTRAEASVMICSFLNFLQKDLQKDYRENILLYN